MTSYFSGRFMRHYLAIFFASVPISITTVVVAVYLSIDLELSPFIVGLFISGSTIAGLFVTHLASIGKIDNIRPNLIIGITVLFSIAMVVLLWAAEYFVWLLILAASFRALSQIQTPALFILDAEVRAGQGGDAKNIYGVRLVVSAAWICGPPIGFVLYAAGGILAVTAAVIVFSIATWALLERTPKPLQYEGGRAEDEPSQTSQEAPSSGRILPLSALYLIMLFAMASNVLHAITLPLHMIENLSIAAAWPGYTQGVQAAVEVAVIALLYRLTRATSEETIMYIGLVLGLGYFAVLPLVTDPLAIVMLQLLYGTHFALSTVVCLGLLNNHPGRSVGSTAGHFVNAGKIGSLVGSSLFALLTAQFGLENMLTFACPCLLVAALVAAAVGSSRATA